jgi:hypothetical protein
MSFEQQMLKARIFRSELVFLSSSHCSRVTAIERRALQSEAMGLFLGPACKPTFWSERLKQRRAPGRVPEKALKLFVSVPRSSSLASRSKQCHRLSSDGE